MFRRSKIKSIVNIEGDGRGGILPENTSKEIGASFTSRPDETAASESRFWESLWRGKATDLCTDPVCTPHKDY